MVDIIRKFFHIVFVTSGNFLKPYIFPTRENLTHKKTNTCIERKVYYAGVLCNFPRSERMDGGPEEN